MSADYPQVTILGGGLLGGSLALALSVLPSPPAVRLWVRREETAAEAFHLGIKPVTCDLEAAVRGADLLVLAVPVGAMAHLVSAALEAGLPGSCLVTDVGSVKNLPHQLLHPLLAPHGISFIGSHPMAGSERGGIAAASSDLFRNAACLLTNDDRASGDKTAALERFWQQIGCHTHWFSARAHDELVARISHLPHLLAASGARICLQDPSQGPFGGGGLRDTTRVAAGNPDMWAEIVTENREALIPPLRETIADLREILASLENGDQEQARHWLVAAKRLRDTLNPLR